MKHGITPLISSESIFGSSLETERRRTRKLINNVSVCVCVFLQNGYENNLSTEMNRQRFLSKKKNIRLL